MEEITEQIANLRMLSAHSAELGLEMARKYQPDLVIMDINLPGMNGIEAMKLLKRAKETRAIPVIALSANAVPQDIKQSLKAGFDEYLTKPINLDQVLAAIKKRLAKKGARKKNQGQSDQAPVFSRGKLIHSKHQRLEQSAREPFMLASW